MSVHEYNLFVLQMNVKHVSKAGLNEAFSFPVTEVYLLFYQDILVYTLHNIQRSTNHMVSLYYMTCMVLFANLVQIPGFS